MIRYAPSGDSAFLLTFGNKISEDTHNHIRAYLTLLEHKTIPGITEVIPSYTTLLVNYDPLTIDYNALLVHLKSLETKLETTQSPSGEVIQIPVLYGSTHGKDLAAVAQHTGYCESEIIQRHTTPTYLVYMLGFTPGFPYLGEMDPRLSTPRKANPDPQIPPGSVGIAGFQTGIYPIQSPGGWHIIGRTPLKLFDPSSDTPFLLKAGDKLKFFPISKEEFNATNQNH